MKLVMSLWVLGAMNSEGLFMNVLTMNVCNIFKTHYLEHLHATSQFDRLKSRTHMVSNNYPQLLSPLVWSKKVIFAK